MNTLTNKYRFVALILLILILSHITIFHFELSQKVLCIGEGNHTHVENIVDSHLNKNLRINNDTKDKFVYNDCTDYKLDHHIDEDFVKTNKLLFGKLKILSNINFDNFINFSFFANSQRTNIIINNIPLDSYSTISLLI